MSFRTRLATFLDLAPDWLYWAYPGRLQMFIFLHSRRTQ